jgi:hypothetical protein
MLTVGKKWFPTTHMTSIVLVYSILTFVTQSLVSLLFRVTNGQFMRNTKASAVIFFKKYTCPQIFVYNRSSLHLHMQHKLTPSPRGLAVTRWQFVKKHQALPHGYDLPCE